MDIFKIWANLSLLGRNTQHPVRMYIVDFTWLNLAQHQQLNQNRTSLFHVKLKFAGAFASIMMQVCQALAGASSSRSRSLDTVVLTVTHMFVQIGEGKYAGRLRLRGLLQVTHWMG